MKKLIFVIAKVTLAISSGHRQTVALRLPLTCDCRKQAFGGAGPRKSEDSRSFAALQLRQRAGRSVAVIEPFES